MPSSGRLSGVGRTYVIAVIVTGLTVIFTSALSLFREPIGYQCLLLAGLTLISGSATIKLPSVPASISISEAFVFSAVLLYGPAAGTLIVALDGLVISFWIWTAKRLHEPLRALFNMSAPALSAWSSSHLFYRLSGIAPLSIEPTPINQILPALLIFALVYFAFNSGLIALAISAETHLPAQRIWKDNFVWLSLNYFCGASVAVLLVTYTRHVDPLFVAVTVPLLLVLYFTFKISIDRVHDATRHVDKINKLYLSTVETLALAIDAKDQITHGHIRRVQHYAVGLAKELGVTDASLLKAIEVAALLHDMGKLAIPEHILNKPGRLTEAEFETMKRHAAIGADILSAIDFPYPVVPIVRHHHEAWNGAGYPDGIKGTAIPLGARILAVVDCFDALTSDRPYRPSLSTNEALHILNDRKGTLYDPLIVTTFTCSLETLQRLVDEPGRSAFYDAAIKAEAETASSNSLGRPLRIDGIASNAELRCRQAADQMLERLHNLVIADLYVFYGHDTLNNQLVAINTFSVHNMLTTQTTIPLGRRISGWVAANRTTVMNSQATIDLVDSAKCWRPPLKSCLSVPVANGKNLLGVVSLYSHKEAGFTQVERETVEYLAEQFGRAVELDADLDWRRLRDASPRQLSTHRA